MIDSLLDMYIYIYSRSWNSPAITDLFEHRFLTSKHVLVLYEPVEVGTKSFKIGICSTAAEKILKQKLYVSELPLNVLCVHSVGMKSVSEKKTS